MKIASTRLRTFVRRARPAFRQFVLGVSLVSIAASSIPSAAGATRPTPPRQSADAVAEKRRAGISPELDAQIASLIAEKEARTPAQKKMDSQLVYAAKMKRGEQITSLVPTLDVSFDNGNKKVAEGDVEVDIMAFKPQLSVVPFLKDHGIEPSWASAEYRSVRAIVPVDLLEEIASMDDVTFVAPAAQAYLSGAGASAGAPKVADASPAPVAAGSRLKPIDGAREGFAERAARVRETLPGAVARVAATRQDDKSGGPYYVGSRQSEGDASHRANLVRSNSGVTGTGVKVGVLSDSVRGLSAAQASGDLPATVTVLTGQSGVGTPNDAGEGTAMLEIVYDLAPGADLYFATGNLGIDSFASNIRALRTAGCDIIVDDLGYFVESPFQDGQASIGTSTRHGGVVTQAVIDVTAAGALYFSSAGNEGNLNDGTSGVYEGDFVQGANGTATVGGTANFYHRFQTSPSVQDFDRLTVGTKIINLHWADPLGGSANDYDLFVTNAAGTSVTSSSTNTQSGTQDPYEQVSRSSDYAVNSRIYVVKKAAAAARYFSLNTNRGALSIATAGQTHGHSCPAAAYCVAATPAAIPFYSGQPNGPYPSSFNASNVLELFSSDGPRRLFFDQNGAAITPGNFSSTGGTVRQKPDITAADGVAVTGSGGAFPTTFYGTSAAAPHAAAIAALVKSASPAMTPAQIRTLLTSTALDIETPGVDRDSGYGILDALSAIQGTVVPILQNAGATLVSESCQPSSGVIDPDETVGVQLCLKNVATGNGTNVTATLQATGGVTNPSGAQSYGALAAGATACQTFTFTASGACGDSITLTWDLADNGLNLGTVTSTFVLGTPIITLSENFDASSSLPSGWTATNVIGSPGWAVTTTTPDSSPNALKAPDNAARSDLQLTSPVIPISGSPARLSFRNKYELEGGYDGAVLEISIGGGAFQDILTAGGSFVSGGYNLSALTDGCNGTTTDSVLLNRPVWTGSSSGYITTLVNLPASVTGSTVQFKWRVGSDCTVAATAPNGQWIDNVQVIGGYTCCVCVPPSVTGNPSDSAANVCPGTSVNFTAGATGTPTPAVQWQVSTDGGSNFTDVTGNASGNTTTLTVVAVAGTPNRQYRAKFTNICGSPVYSNAATLFVDAVAPTVFCPGNITKPADSNSCTTVVTYATPGASDTCSGNVTVTCLPASGSVFTTGTTTVTCSATDAAGNTGSCSFSVIVTDSTAPSVTCPSNITQGNDPNQCGAVVTYTTPSASDNCPGATVACLPASGSFFPMGTTTVTCTATDSGGLTGQCTFTVTVNDTQNPTVTCPSNITQAAAAGQCSATVTYTTPSASDNCTGATVACLPASGSSFSVGTTTVTCTATDASNNHGTCTFTVTVNDTQNPTVTCPSNITKGTDANQCSAVVTYTTPTASDNCPGATVACLPASGSAFPKGTTTVTCTATDASGNHGACTFTVTVNDTQNPTVTCPSNITKGTDANQCGAVVTYTTPSASDNCPGATVACLPASGSFFAKGTTTVTCTATDTSNNHGACTFTVTVNDTQAPSIACPTNKTATATAISGCTFGATVTFAAPTVSDNCAVASVACVPASGSFFPTGTTVVTCTATDTSGNQSQCTFTVTVSLPNAVCLNDENSHDSFVEVVDTASPLYGYWRYTVFATGETICGKANSTSYQANRTLVSYDKDYSSENTAWGMDVNANFGTRTATVNLAKKGNVRTFLLRDRDTTNNPACDPQAPPRP